MFKSGLLAGAVFLGVDDRLDSPVDGDPRRCSAVAPPNRFVTAPGFKMAGTVADSTRRPAAVSPIGAPRFNERLASGDRRAGRSLVGRKIIMMYEMMPNPSARTWRARLVGRSRGL